MLLAAVVFCSERDDVVGGSTIVILFEKGMVEWDEDLLINGRASLETLVLVGMGIGRRRNGTSSSPVKAPTALPQ